MKNGNISNKVSNKIFIDAESLFDLSKRKIRVVRDEGIFKKVSTLAKEFNVVFFLDKKSKAITEDDLSGFGFAEVLTIKRAELGSIINKERTLFLVASEKLNDYQDLKAECIFPIELSVENIKLLF